MQQAIFQQAGFKPVYKQATRVIPDQVTGMQDSADNDETRHDKNSPLRLLFSILANAIGGVILLSLMFVLPHVIARILS